MTKGHSVRKRCPCCQKQFTPDRRVGARQKFCSQKACQTRRQRINETDWRMANPECVSTQRKKWREANPEYMSTWWSGHPEAVKKNRANMRRHMRCKRDSMMFEKSKEIASQITGNNGDIYVSRGRGWILARLKRASIWSGGWVRRYACRDVEAGSVRLPRGRLYDLGKPFG